MTNKAERAAQYRKELGCDEGGHRWVTVGKGDEHNQEGFIYCAYCYQGYNGGHYRSVSQTNALR